MADYFVQHDPQPGDVAYGGSNDGTSWENALQDLTAITPAANDRFLIKEHAGVDCSLGGLTLSVPCEIHGGFDAALTGTAFNLSQRTGQTVLDGNNADVHGMVITDTVTISRLRFTAFAHTTEHGSAISATLVAETLTIDTCEFDNNTCSFANNTSGAALYVNGDASSFLDVTATIVRDHDTSWGSTLFFAGDFDAQFDRCCICDNIAARHPAMEASSDGVLLFRNTFIAGNTSTSTGCFYGITIHMVNCTLGGNVVADTEATASVFWEGRAYNCIVYGNTSDVDIEAQYSTFYYENSDIQILGSNVTDNGGNVSVDPQYLGLGDYPYELSGSSPNTVTTGGSTTVTDYVNEDYFGDTRDVSTPSMGAHEYSGSTSPTHNLAVLNTATSLSALGYSASFDYSVPAIAVSIECISLGYSVAIHYDVPVLADTITVSDLSYALDVLYDVVSVSTGNSFQNVAYTAALTYTVNALSSAANIAANDYLLAAIYNVATLNTDSAITPMDYATGADNVLAVLNTGASFNTLEYSLSATYDIDALVGNESFSPISYSVDIPYGVDTLTASGVFGAQQYSLDVGYSLPLIDSVISLTPLAYDVGTSHSLAHLNTVVVLAPIEYSAALSYTLPLVSAAYDFTALDYSVKEAGIITVSTLTVLYTLSNVSVHQETLNEFHQLLYVEDFENVFLNLSEFAINASYYHTTLEVWASYPVLFDDPDDSVGTGDNTDTRVVDPQIVTSERMLNHYPVRGDKVVVKGKEYWVEDSSKDGAGSVTIYMRRR